MLIRLLELGERVDRIIFADTGYEFPELYEYIDRIEQYIGRPIERVYPDKPFSEWFYGTVTRGAAKGKPRGFPLVAFPCYWTREAKVKPLQKAQEGATRVFVGIAADEQKRIRNTPPIEYPLVNWGWSEQDCVNYLNSKGLLNPLYVNFNRLGCWFCPKQGEGALFVLWRNYPDLWRKFELLDQENIRLTGKPIKVDFTLKELAEAFAQGRVINKLPKYDCTGGCEGVKRAFKEKQKKLIV